MRDILSSFYTRVILKGTHRHKTRFVMLDHVDDWFQMPLMNNEGERLRMIKTS